jgi:hypothetical protein
MPAQGLGHRAPVRKAAGSVGRVAFDGKPEAAIAHDVGHWPHRARVRGEDLDLMASFAKSRGEIEGVQLAPPQLELMQASDYSAHPIVLLGSSTPP